VADVLRRIHRSYLEPVGRMLDAGLVNALAHITGGGIPENLARVLPPGLEAHVDTAAWTPPAEFRAIAELGPVQREEMIRTFNMGVGLLMVLRIGAWALGDVRAGTGGVVLH